MMTSHIQVLVLSFGLLWTVGAFASDNLVYGVPNADCIVDRIGYALGYSEEHEQALWVMYRLTREEVLTRKAVRTEDFREDPNIVSFSAHPSDYSRSGYDRGHLAPAEDMKFSEATMRDSFYMSNMTPQCPEFNRGVWKKLEKQIRRLAYKEGSVFVITGPVFGRNPKKIGKMNRVSVPQHFYKIVYAETPPQKMIAYVLPNKGSSLPLESFATTVDEVERITGLDFFSELPLDVQTKLESELDVTDWGNGGVRFPFAPARTQAGRFKNAIGYRRTL